MNINREYKSLDPTTRQGFQKGKLCLIQLVLVTGQGSFFTTQRIPIAQFFLSYWEKIKICILASEQCVEERKWNVSLTLGLYSISCITCQCCLEGQKIPCAANRYHSSPKGTNLADPALLAVFYLPLFLFFLWVKEDRQNKDDYAASWICWLLVAL